MTLIAVLADGELPTTEVARLEHHLSECGPCRAAQAAEGWMLSLLAAGALSEAPPDSLRQRIRQRIADLVGDTPRERRRRFLRALLPAAFGGALVALVALALVVHLHRDSTIESPVLVDALAGHRQYTDVTVPHLDVRGDARRVERWIRERLGLAVRLPPRAARGETAVGARVATMAGDRAAQVLYASDGRQISLFVARKPALPLPEEGEHIIDGAEVYVAGRGASHLGWWQDGVYLYVAVSAEGETDLLGLAALCLKSQRAPEDAPMSGAEADRGPGPAIDRRSLGRESRSGIVPVIVA